MDRLEAGLNEICVLAFQYKAAQLTSGISPGIYVDAVRADFWRSDRASTDWRHLGRLAGFTIRSLSGVPPAVMLPG